MYLYIIEIELCRHYMGVMMIIKHHYNDLSEPAALNISVV